MTPITIREPNGKRFTDRTGTTTIHGIKVNSFVGFSGKYTIWNCTCPICGREFLLRSNSMCRQKACSHKCSMSPRRVEPLVTYFKAYWKLTLRKHCHPAWNTFEQFWKDVGCRLQRHERVYCANPRYRIGPDNFLIADGRVMGNCGPRARLFFAAGEYWTVKRMAEFFGCSKQNITQKIAYPGGGLRLKNEIEMRVLMAALKESR